MKLKTYLVLLLFLSISLFVFAIPSSASDEAEVLKKLNEKRNEIGTVLNKYMMGKQKNKDKLATFMSYLLINERSLYLSKNGTVTSNPTVEQIITHMQGVIDKEDLMINISYHGFGPHFEEAKQGDEAEHDYEAYVSIKLEYKGNSTETDIISFGLWHQRICIWW